MNAFKDFGIQRTEKNFSGQKVKMSKVLNKQIKILGYKIEKSDFNDKGNGKRLCLHFEDAGTKHIVFTSSIYLQNDIQKIPADGFPFTTTIVEEDDTYYFT